MLKYIAAATVLKFFSLNSTTKHIYRSLGNRLGSQKRANFPMPDYYLNRIQWKVDLCRKYNILNNEDWVLELGTGWVHWETVTLRLFFDIKAVLYDVWDNRQLVALKSFLRQVDIAFEQGYRVEGVDLKQARQRIRQMMAVSTFDELYSLFGFRYVVDPTCTLKSLEHNKFRLVVSSGVFEHIRRESLLGFINGWAQLIEPGGFAIHGIHIGDHLYAYDPSTSPKQYLAFSERAWKLIGENGVQYINRVQRSEWFEMFNTAGLWVKEESGTFSNLGKLKIHKRYAGMDRRDLECTNLRVVLQKTG